MDNRSVQGAPRAERLRTLRVVRFQRAPGGDPIANLVFDRTVPVAKEFQHILVASMLAERRPAGDLARLDKMLRHADVIVTARDAGRLVGVSRAVTDFSYCCYLSDLAVDFEYQRRGIGKRLIAETHAAAGEATTLILVAAPAAETYYPKIGMQHLMSCWAIPRKG